MLERRQGIFDVGGGSGSGSSCTSCDESIDYGSTLDIPSIQAALAFSAINTILFLVLFVFAFFVRPFVTRDGHKRTRFGLIATALFFLLSQLYDLIKTVVEGVASLTFGYVIQQPFFTLFGFLADVTVVWTIFGFLYARIHALHGHNRLASGVRITAIVMLSILCVLAAAYLALYCTTIAYLLGNSGYVYRSGVYRMVQAAMRGLGLTFDVLRLACAAACIGIGIKVFLDYRRSSNFSKIPTILLASTLPAFFVACLARVVLDGAYDYGDAEDYVDLPVIVEILRGLLYGVVLGGLVFAGTRPDWSAAGAHAGPGGPHSAPFNPGFDPSAWGHHQQQHPAPPPQGYGYAQPYPAGPQHGAPPHGHHPPPSMSVSSPTSYGGAPSAPKSELSDAPAGYPEMPAGPQDPYAVQGGRNHFFRGGPQPHGSELPAGGAGAGYRGAGSPPPRSELPGALQAGNPPAQAEMHTPRRF